MQMISVRLCHCLKSEIFRNTDQGNHHALASTVKIDMEILPFDMTTAGIPVAAMAEQMAYLFWLTLIFLCQRLQVLVGANIRPPLHMFPKAPWPDLWVPPPLTRGIRATALPVPHDSAEVWCPKINSKLNYEIIHVPTISWN